MKQRLFAIAVLTGSALLAVSGIRLSRTFATLGEFGRIWQMPVTASPSKTIAPQNGAVEALPPGVSTPLARVPLTALDARPQALPAATANAAEDQSPLPSTAEFPVAPDPDDYELRAALKSALVDDLEFYELLDHSDPEIRAGVVEYLQQGSSR